jgi:hypothetical protein
MLLALDATGASLLLEATDSTGETPLVKFVSKMNWPSPKYYTSGQETKPNPWFHIAKILLDSSADAKPLMRRKDCPSCTNLVRRMHECWNSSEWSFMSQDFFSRRINEINISFRTKIESFAVLSGLFSE